MSSYTDRRDYTSGGHRGGGGGYRGSGGYGGGGARGGGRGGGYRGGRGGYHRGGRQAHTGTSPYSRHSGGTTNGGPRRSGNRFAVESTRRDPQQELLRNLLVLLHQVGDLQSTNRNNNNNNNSNSNDNTSPVRTIVTTQKQNIQGLTQVLCGNNPELFLQHEAEDSPANIQYAEQLAGPLAAGLVHAIMAAPLQTPCYVGMTLAVHVTAHARDATLFGGFASRCVRYATRAMARDLDALLLDTDPNSSTSSTTHSGIGDSGSGSTTTRQSRVPSHRLVVRVRMLLRYLVLLARAGILQLDHDTAYAVTGPAHSNPVSVLGLLQTMVQAARQAKERDGNQSVAVVLASLVLSTVPYLATLLPSETVRQTLVQPLEAIVQSYRSTFAPGFGCTAILLREEQIEDIGASIEEEDDEEEDDDEEEEEGSEQVCDNFQDLMRTVQYWVKQEDTTVASRLALFRDAPWEGLEAKVSSLTSTTLDASEIEESAHTPLVYTETPLTIPIFTDCQSLSALVGGLHSAPEDDSLCWAEIDLDGIFVGRLPIFGPPPEVADNDDDEDDDQDMEAAAPVNERLQAYRSGYGMVDRYFIHEAIRDCLTSHESYVTDTGVEIGNAKTAAEQVWSIIQMVTGDSTNGLEYAVLEAIFSLIVQSNAVSSFRFVYLSRVLLELTRLEPAIMSPAIAIAVSTLFQDYMPTLVPMARYNLSRWFAFHLVNTDYQWPAAYWKHWEPFVQYGWKNSRGAFVKGALAILLENESDAGMLVKECLPKNSLLVDHLLPGLTTSALPDDSALASFAKDVSSRIWDNREDEHSLLQYIVGDELSESVTTDLAGLPVGERTWWRTHAVARALLSVTKQEHTYLALSIAQERTANEDAMDATIEAPADILSLLLDALVQYTPLLLGVLAKDLDGQASADAAPVQGELHVLQEISNHVLYSRTTLDAVVSSLLHHKVVSPDAVVRWSLGDMGQETPGVLAIHWWDMSTMAIHYGLTNLFAVTPASNQGEMQVEDNQDESPTMKNARLFLEPIIEYTVGRICHLLSSASHTVESSKLTNTQVDLVEGFKCLVRQTKRCLLHVLLSSSVIGQQLRPATVRKYLTNSCLSGSNLLSMCQETDGSSAMNTFRTSLKFME